MNNHPTGTAAPPASGESAEYLAPKNQPLREQNPDSWIPPKTDAGDVDTFKYPFAFDRRRVHAGGWSRQVTVRDLPIAKAIAGVNMRLDPGGIRELHWHNAAEWAFMIRGTARITGVDTEGRSSVTDVGKGDLWYFPSGIPHSIQGLGGEGCEFLLIFDDGNFSEFDTFLIADWMAHTPRDVLAKNFGLPQSAFERIPDHELFIFAAPLPASLEQDRREALGPEGEVPLPFDYHLLAQPPDKQTDGGEVRIADSRKFKISTTIAAALVHLKPGALRELHWHPNADEWQYYITGRGRMTVFTGGARARTMDFQAGDVGYVEINRPHYVENTGDSDLEFLEMFKSDHFEDMSLAQWIAHLPPELVEAHLHLDRRALRAIPKDKQVIAPARPAGD